MGLLVGIPIFLVGITLLVPLFQTGGAGFLYLKWLIMQLDVVAAAGCSWALLGYSLMRVVADKLFLRTSGDKVRVLS